MDRYETLIEDGVFYVDGPDRRIEVGEMAAILDELGEVYELEYSDEERAVPWLDVDEDGILAFDVRETLLDVSFDDEFVDTVTDAPLDEPAGDGDLPDRTATFVELMRDIWDSKGDPDGL